MKIRSLDPRITRLEIEKNKEPVIDLKPLDHWQTFEVFVQVKKGQHHSHVGSLHAPNPEMAYILAKEQFGRRTKIVSLWVVKTADVFTAPGDEIMFERNDEKIYREAGGYKVMDRINRFKKSKK
ncbi:MAG: hypothetical protein OZ913_02390 [Ignavibacteriaceae bacterium]|jgi:phenylacetate-CoA oxygenase, PaaH subunit|nr:MAG: 1,2-phenylacetyl-CoA epoxidase subunit B [Chlorobiota bacterium]KXK06053.1 MAG: 1,2-phenylacetyl-CoA epoxidase, subunit B [Chlorobi bacterium OLB4]MBV6398488.1 hypothetical protein [Ignavibacteria bacterium]MCC6885722.1 1,2-phenylacetyl-CoA epoxidase subunit B [Ignavibacteriales bacterium]MCE7953083.1 1,2-phenylacetyl-CoA epoxidase subunit B [Chlorobi bacterium CHB7]MDL1887079.1 1,2-phenylacetyl-CoA epoxidase subunit B [Ignavibacteria bacterium CHB1]MEB2329134.1 hypothetical protein [